MTHIRIVMTDHGRGEVFVDGARVRGVSEVEFSAKVGIEANRVRLCILAHGVEIDGPAEVSHQRPQGSGGIGAAPRCLDCAHYLKLPPHLSIPPMCLHPDSRDLVGMRLSCTDARYIGPCGRDGALFEPKPPQPAAEPGPRPWWAVWR